ncbi:hypothetical protein FHX15_000229 [Rhizobium sp. BK650]|uniref:hypothetical protein n=1 Tax=Rhizobium sp. BK650 TaxID=2586990 RepID=UPI001611A16D|nr:hypothetical protein [Rhizobium sp. BK650]MBB3655030.1 hypothetical protein [Rhizobium sp. BK650]
MTIEGTTPAGSANVLDAISASHILHPHRHFSHPDEVLASDRITAEEKRAIFASWASDLHAVESCPELRHPPGVPCSIRYQDILAALKSLDRSQSLDRGRQDFPMKTQAAARKLAVTFG